MSGESELETPREVWVIDTSSVLEIRREKIENLLRAWIGRSFPLEEIRAAKNPTDTAREIDDVSDLTFGEYVRLVEPLDAWPKLKVTFDRNPFLKELGRIRDLRNDVMHFDPDPLGDADLALLRNFAVFLERGTGG